ncbi:PREDICTED: protein FAM107B, partial [Cariama cristata]|uniref:protein FAM107B n=1 Tax=Cariama cristata TaxID=54380 RepID=UPI000520E84C
MHPFPCSALLTCFGNAHENTPFDQPNTSPLAMEEEKTEATSAVCLQPSAIAASSIKHGGKKDSEEMFKASRCSEKHSRASSNFSNHAAAPSVSATTESSVFAANELSHDVIALCTHIPRPSIIHVPKVSALEVAMQQDCEDHCFVDHGTMQDPDVVLASRCAVSQAPALLLAVRNSPAEWPDHKYYAALVGRGETMSNGLN